MHFESRAALVIYRHTVQALISIGWKYSVDGNIIGFRGKLLRMAICQKKKKKNNNALDAEAGYLRPLCVHKCPSPFS